MNEITQIRMRMVLLLILLYLLVLTGNGWGNELNGPEWIEILGSETLYSGEEVVEILEESLLISDQEYQKALKDQEDFYEKKLERLGEELQLERKKMSRWKTFLLVETGLVTGLLIHEIWGKE